MRTYLSRFHKWADRHHRVIHKGHSCLHLSYFALIMFHGPYHYAASALLIFGALLFLMGENV